MEEYITRMKGFADELALPGSPIAMDDLVLHTLNGLDGEYNAIVVKLIDKTSLSWIKAQSVLLLFESRLNQLSHFSTFSIQPSINTAQHDAPNATQSDSGFNHSGRSSS
ncbi:hypothetical protein QN277_012451 [Acacia crassicarpa]|uniref:Uncharacterized protein n=1 Tax=Acacia crassicarpa TaxID=499986 RepID=A0AAE1TD02_9FABA|nr:hypothetical protein QN277_012451 [Acacia crassicarpa]